MGDQGIDVPQAIVRFMYLTLVIICMSIIFSTYKADKIDIRYAESEIISGRLLLADTIAYEDATGTAHQGIIDTTKLTDTTLTSATTTTQRVGIRARLLDKDGKIIREAYVNRVLYDTLRPLAIAAKTGVSGAGGAQEYPSTWPVQWLGPRDGQARITLQGITYDPGTRVLRVSALADRALTASIKATRGSAEVTGSMTISPGVASIASMTLPAPATGTTVPPAFQVEANAPD
ncbi:hypothetical protein COY28_06120, partial [Candidatus Woesearchaeota archaeon CG_4_10_14_0_2_um_filter_57_5]